MFCLFVAVLLAVTGGQLLPGINIDVANPGGNPPASAVNVTGAGIVRIEFKDASPAGPIPDSTFQMYDPVVSDYSSFGIRILFIIDYMTYQNTPWGKTDNASWAPYVTQLATRASQISAHYAQYGSNISYEVWNEEDLQQTFVPANIYSVMLTSVYAAVKGSSPTSAVIFGGLASGDPTYVTDVAATGPITADGLGLHPYGQRPSPNWPSPTWGFGVLGQLMANYAQVTTLPMWITEIGTSDMTCQGQFPYNAFVALIEAESSLPCPVAIWFCWSDNMVAPFGLVDTTNTPKESYYSFQNFTAQYTTVL